MLAPGTHFSPLTLAPFLEQGQKYDRAHTQTEAVENSNVSTSCHSHSMSPFQDDWNRHLKINVVQKTVKIALVFVFDYSYEMNLRTMLRLMQVFKLMMMISMIHSIT